MFINILYRKICGMRHPSSGLSEDDLSRLTGSSSSSSASSSSSNSPSHKNTPPNNGNLKKSTSATTKGCSIISSPTLKLAIDEEQAKNLKNTQQQLNTSFHSSYLPEIIDPLEWQKSRKRKERQDSTSSITQDRKLVRSNSEELLTNADCEVIRRVSSSEDFKRPLQEINNENLLKTIEENDSQFGGIVEIKKKSQIDKKQEQENQNSSINGAEMTRRPRLETSPARSSHRVSPNRENRKQRDSDESECEHERRRSSERFCKSRPPPGRKAGVMKKSGKYVQKLPRNDENVYKYDISALKYERRGFVSKFKAEERGQRKEEATDGEQIVRHDYNDNNLIDFHTMRNGANNQMKTSDNQKPPTTKIITQQPQLQSSSSSSIKSTQSSSSSSSTSSSTSSSSATTLQTQKSHQKSGVKYQTPAEALPWNNSNQQEHQTPVLSRRFDLIEEIYADDDYNQYPISTIITDNEPVKSFRTFTTIENLKTREIMQQAIDPALTMTFQMPEERMKHVNKKLTALKKRLNLLEENFEKRNGYRPSQAEKMSDKHIKSAIVEIGKLRKEKQELKQDPMAAMGLKINGGISGAQKLEKMKDTLSDIEQKLCEKRREANRSENLENLTANQLVQEKSAVQHGLLFFEGLYGRPATKEERDVVRPLYDRYRGLKRMVTRSVPLTGISSGPSELPTILEHEAMEFNFEPVLPHSISTDSGNSNELPNDSASDNSNSAPSSTSDTTTTELNPTTSETVQQEQQPSSSSSSFVSLNFQNLTVDELCEHLKKAREEKRLMKDTIQEYETLFEEQTGRKMLKSDRKIIDDTYLQYKELKAKVRLLQALVRKHVAR